jgi:hypothetical protein
VFVSLGKAVSVYGAKMKNARWSVSAIATDGAIVISCWQMFFSRGMIYTDSLSRWHGNKLGNDELRTNIERAFRHELPVRLVIAHPENEADIDGVWDASKVPKKFSVRPDLEGRVVEFDGDKFVIQFSKSL